ncbi:DNA-directed RNA polymerase, partial [Cladochytrium tenue]
MSEAEVRKEAEVTGLYGTVQEQLAVIWACLQTDNVERAEVLYRRLERLFPEQAKESVTEGMANAFIEAYLAPTSLAREKARMKRQRAVVTRRAGARPKLATVVTNWDKALAWHRKVAEVVQKRPGVAGFAILLRHTLAANDLALARSLLADIDRDVEDADSWVERIRADPHFAEPEDLAALDTLLRSTGKLKVGEEAAVKDGWTAALDALMLSAMDEAAESAASKTAASRPTTDQQDAEGRSESDELLTTDSVGVNILKRTLDGLNIEAEIRDLNEETDETRRLMKQLKLQQILEEKALVAAAEEKEQLFEQLPEALKEFVKMPSRFVMQWNAELVPLIRKELAALADSTKLGDGADVAASESYGMFLRLLTPEQLSRITITECLRRPEASETEDMEDLDKGSFLVIDLMFNIGAAIEREYQLQKLVKLKGKKKMNLQSSLHTLHMRNQLSDSSIRSLVSRLAQEEDKKEKELSWQMQWPTTVRVKAGSLLLALLLKVARVLVPTPDPEDPSKDILKEEMAFQHLYMVSEGKRYGVIRLHPLVLEQLSMEPVSLHPRFLPMVVKPRPWVTRNSGGYLNFKTDVVRVNHNPEHMAYIAAADERNHLVHIYEALDVLGETPWRINDRVYSVMRDVWNDGKALAGFPPASRDPPPEKPADFDSLPVAEKRKFYLARNKAETEKRNFFSQRCDINYKMEIAKAFRGLTIYFPHNLDFRGRAYPVASHLNHMGNDICRGLLLFDEAKPLGEVGLRWLKIQVASLAGFDKASHDDRVRFCDEHMDDVVDSADHPLDGRRWWLQSEDPWQLLATIFELAEAVRSPDPSQYLSRVPVHQDGTCNGLQHYAALGGDELGAAQVNLVPSDKPSDIYSGVADKVRAAVEQLAAGGCELSKKLVGRINRKLVKQTVMTNTYGVTFVGARRQVLSRMKENPELYPFSDQERAELSVHVTRLIFQSLGELFEGASAIQDWLNTTAALVARCVRPEDIPKIQLDDAAFLAELGCLPGPFTSPSAVTVAVAGDPAGAGEAGSSAAPEPDLLEAAIGDVSGATDEASSSVADARAALHEVLGELESATAVGQDAVAEAATDSTSSSSSSTTASTKMPERMSSVIWTSPLGLPIVQPYRQVKVKTITTVLQTVNIMDTSTPKPVNAAKQSSAFPPNFIHSLDATHMMLSAAACRRAGILFAAVHDSYWTHAADVPRMAELLRKAFVRLHSMHVMRRLSDELGDRFRNAKLPADGVIADPAAARKWADRLTATGRRRPAAAAARSLADLPKGDSARLVVLKFDASEPDVAAADAAAIVATLQTDHAVPRLDVVVSNAGAVTDTSPVAAVGADAMLTHFKINTLAPLALYQVLWPALLSKGGVQRPPVFLGVSSTAGRIQDALEMPLAAYGASKAALNFVVSKIHAENKDIIAFVVHPGWVKTKMGNAAAHIAGLDEAPLSIEESVAGLVKL